MDHQTDLTLTPDTELDELVKKNLALEEEVKTLTLKNMELTQKLEMYEPNGNVGVEGHNEEIVPFGPEMNEEVGAKLFEGHVHPLLIDVILENLFSYVGRRDLLACRGVCHKWNELTIPFTRSKFTVRIQLSSEFLHHSHDPNCCEESFICRRLKDTRNKQTGNPEEKNTRTIEDFVAVFRKTLGIPFAKFKLGPFCTTDVIGQQFLKICGDTTTELDLCQEKEGNEVYRIEDVSAILRSMTKLKKLSMSDQLVSDSGNVVELFPGAKPELISLKSFTLEPDTPDGPIECCPSFLEELMRAAVNISAISVADSWHLLPNDADDDEYGQNGNIVQALSVIENLGRESSIQSLRLGRNGIKMRPHVEMLQRMGAKSNGFKLKKLSFCMSTQEEETEQFQFLDIFKDTLQDLEIKSFSSGFTNFPKMPKLRRLALNFYGDFNSGLVNLNKLFPILKELIVYENGGEDDSIFEFLPQSDPCPTVKSLSLSRCGLRINALSHILTLFPTLTKLVIEFKECNHEILRQIWTQMTQLESLSIMGEVESKESMDSLFTGIPTNTIQDITGILKCLDKMSIQWRRDTILNLRSHHSQLPSIGNLTKLRSLTLGVSVTEETALPDSLKYISDVSGFLGFYSLKHLSHLSVRDSKLTKTCCEMLTMEMGVGLEFWEFTSVDGQAIIPLRKD